VHEISLAFAFPLYYRFRAVIIPTGDVHPSRRLVSNRFFSALVLSLFSLSVPFATAANTINVPAQQPTIQDGINVANPGDTVLVAPGTYIENINSNGKAITVASSAGPTSAIINCGTNSASDLPKTKVLDIKCIVGGTVDMGAYEY
jgi:hypothetical protein